MAELLDHVPNKENNSESKSENIKTKLDKLTDSVFDKYNKEKEDKTNISKMNLREWLMTILE